MNSQELAHNASHNHAAQVVIIVFSIIIGWWALSLEPADDNAYASTTVLPGLISQWNFDEGSGSVATDNISSHNGTLANGASWTTGRLGGAVSLNGTSGTVDVPHNTDLTPSQLSFAFWVKRDSAQSDWAKIINKGSNAGAPYASYKVEFNGPSDTMLYASMGFTDNTNAAAGNTTPLADGFWNHIGVTYDGTVLKFYLNGVLEGLANVPGKTIKFDDLPLIVGSGGGFGYFKGAVDDLRLYNRALSACEISNIYSDGVPDLIVTGVVVNTNPINLSGCQNLTIDAADYTLKNNVVLRGQATLTVKNGTLFNHASDYSGQYTLEAYDDARVIIENSTVKSSPWINWNFRNNAELQMTSVTNNLSQIWHGFNDSASAVVSGVSKFYGTANVNASIDVDGAEQTFIETVFAPLAVVDESFPPSVGPTAYSFPNGNDTGVNTALVLRNIANSIWGITYTPQDDITIRDTDSLVVTFSIPSTYSDLNAVFDGLRAQLYPDTTWTTGGSKLRLINTRTLPWSPIVGGNNSLTITNSELADNSYSSGNATVSIASSTMSFIHGKDYVNFTITNSTISGDVVAAGNSVINLVNTTVAGQTIQRDSGIVNVQGAPDITAPTVHITSPNNNSTVIRGKTSVITANASDASGVARVEFLVNSILKCTATTMPYSCNWAVPNQKNITYKLAAKAYDLAGNSATSSLINVTAK